MLGSEELHFIVLVNPKERVVKYQVVAGGIKQCTFFKPAREEKDSGSSCGLAADQIHELLRAAGLCLPPMQTEHLQFLWGPLRLT